MTPTDHNEFTNEKRDVADYDSQTNSFVSNENDLVCSDNEEINRKILQVIEYSFTSKIRKMLRRLFVFILTFGNNEIGVNSSGNVTIKGKVIDPKSNIIELLEVAAVGQKGSQVPAGYEAFLTALTNINVPSTFIHGQILGDEIQQLSTQKESNFRCPADDNLKRQSKSGQRQERKWKPY
jgi:hypothetical protein